MRLAAEPVSEWQCLEQLGARFHPGRARPTQTRPHGHLERLNRGPAVSFQTNCPRCSLSGTGILPGPPLPSRHRIYWNPKTDKEHAGCGRLSRLGPRPAVLEGLSQPTGLAGDPKAPPPPAAPLPPSLPGRSQLLTSPFRKFKTRSCYCVFFN